MTTKPRPHLDPFLLELPGHEITIRSEGSADSNNWLECDCGWAWHHEIQGFWTNQTPLALALQNAYNHHEVVRNRDLEFTSQDV
jgi:hypothetical protein